MVLSTAEESLTLTGVQGSGYVNQLVSSVGTHLPSKPLLLAGALGGPSVIFGLTPLRNAITLASQDQRSSALAIYKRVFQIGGWTGGLPPSGPACPQFVIMGPLYHFWAGFLGSDAAAVGIISLKETLLTFGSQTRNAQMAVNKTLPACQQLPLSPMFRLKGPGMSFHIARNILGMSGLRLASEPAQDGVRKVHSMLGWSAPTSRLTGDFLACFAAGAASMIPNQIYNFACTTPTYGACRTVSGRLELVRNFLTNQYFTALPCGGRRISPTVLRDLILRCNYNATLWVAYGTIERTAIQMFD